MNETQVLVIEDEPEIRKFLNVTLTSHGYHPDFAETAKKGLNFALTYAPELVILDLGLPDMDGLDVITAIRARSAVPIIVLSARGQEKDKVTALESGADDYLTKPFGVPELLARIKVALRHSRPVATQANTIEAGRLRIDLENRQVWLEGTEIHLTRTEYKLLCVLAKHAGKLVTQQQLLKEVWGLHSTQNSHYLRVYTQHLRRKLGDDPMRPRYIITETGIGYRFKGD